MGFIGDLEPYGFSEEVFVPGLFLVRDGDLLSARNRTASSIGGVSPNILATISFSSFV